MTVGAPDGGRGVARHAPVFPVGAVPRLRVERAVAPSHCGLPIASIFSRSAHACLMSWLGPQSTTSAHGHTAEHKKPIMSFTNFVRFRPARLTKWAEALRQAKSWGWVNFRGLLGCEKSARCRLPSRNASFTILTISWSLASPIGCPNSPRSRRRLLMPCGSQGQPRLLRDPSDKAL